MNTLDIGCGQNKTTGAIGLDIEKYDGVDVVHDLNRFPYPFQDSYFDRIICHDVLEHVDDVIAVMIELYRISAPDCILEINVPSPSSFDLWNDLQHRRAFTSCSFDLFIAGTKMFERNTSPAQFRLLLVEYEKDRPRSNFLDRLLVKFANRFKKLYEHRLLYIIQTYSVYFQLQAIKTK